jgi:hypothetical protein
MIRISLTYFYDVGLRLNRLRAIRPGAKLNEVWLDLFTVQGELETLLTSSIVSSAVRASYAPAQALVNTLKRYTDIDFDAGETMMLSPQEVANLGRDLTAFETVLRAEFAAADAYFVLPKGGYDTLRLVTQGEVVWPPDLWAKVPEAVTDAREAGKCIAFELATAAGFHIMRALEAVLLRYWDKATNGKARPTNRNLGNYLAQLEKGGFGDPKIIAALRQIKDLHRNSLMHPEDTLTVQEAIELLGITQSAASAMLRELPLLKQAEPTPADPLENVELSSPAAEPSAS